MFNLDFIRRFKLNFMYDKKFRLNSSIDEDCARTVSVVNGNPKSTKYGFKIPISVEQMDDFNDYNGELLYKNGKRDATIFDKRKRYLESSKEVYFKHFDTKFSQIGEIYDVPSESPDAKKVKLPISKGDVITVYTDLYKKLICIEVVDWRGRPKKRYNAIKRSNEY